jgi:hypothetical protein
LLAAGLLEIYAGIKIATKPADCLGEILFLNAHILTIDSDGCMAASAADLTDVPVSQQYV